MPLQGWLDGNWMLPQIQGAVAPNPKTLKGIMASLTPEASSVNQTKALQCVFSTYLPSSPPLTFLTHPVSPLSRSTAWQGCAKTDNYLPARTHVGTVDGQRVCLSYRQGRT